MRSEEHQKWLIDQYNRNRPIEDQVKNMEELNRALLTEEIIKLKEENKKD